MPRSRRAAAAFVCALGVVTVSGCSDQAVPLSVPSPSPAAAAACAQLHGTLPDTVLGQSAVATDPESDLTAAWGDPAITLTCGVPPPTDRPQDAQLFEVDGITWFAQELTNGVRFTSEERVAHVQVDVPIDYRPEAEALIDLAEAITAAVPVSSDSATPST